MALKELQTAACAFVHVVRPTDRDVATLQQRFQLHPHDAEALLSVQSGNRLRPFRNYVFASFLWPTYDDQRKELRQWEISLLAGPTMLVIVDHQGTAEIEDFVDQQFKIASPHSQASPASLLGELLVQLGQKTERQVVLFTRDVRTSLQDVEAHEYGESLLRLSETIQSLLPYEFVDSASDNAALLRIAGHRFHHRGRELVQLRRATLKPATQFPTTMPRLVRSYAWASAVTAIVMLGWLIGR